MVDSTNTFKKLYYKIPLYSRQRLGFSWDCCKGNSYGTWSEKTRWCSSSLVWMVTKSCTSWYMQKIQKKKSSYVPVFHSFRIHALVFEFATIHRWHKRPLLKNAGQPRYGHLLYTTGRGRQILHQALQPGDLGFIMGFLLELNGVNMLTSPWR